MLKTKQLYCKPGFPFSRVLRKWIGINKALAKEWASLKDVPWWYNERADLSILAGAIWRVMGSVLEEYVDTKYAKGSRPRRRPHKFTGRIDLGFTVGGHDFVAEAKQCWSGASAKGGNPARRVRKALQRACADIRESKPRGNRRLGIVFAKPYVRKNHKKQVDELLAAWAKKIEDGVECDAMAWVFPQCARRIAWHNRLYPGAVILVKEVKGGRRSTRNGSGAALGSPRRAPASSGGR